MGEDRRQLRHELKQLFSQIPRTDKDDMKREDGKGLKNNAEDGQEEQDSTWTGSEAESDDDTPFFDHDLVGAGAERHWINDPEALSLPLE